MMEFLRRARATHRPRISIVLADWSVRESFHSLHYLNQQTADRDDYELLWIEYYSSRPEKLARAVDAGLRLDTWIRLQMPASTCYHKHLIYNVGLLASCGEIVVFCDSDAIYRPGFVASLCDSFDERPEQVLYVDQVRSESRRFYPFSYPGVDEIHKAGRTNLTDGRPRGLGAVEDRLHVANYGACMAARRADLLRIGGADEHLDYLGHICGSYEMGFRLRNLGLEEIWHPTEWTYHVWHPGSSGVSDYHGPHDGRGISTTALAALSSGRTLPLVENPGVRSLRLAPSSAADDALAMAVAPDRLESWSLARLSAPRRLRVPPGTWLWRHPGLGMLWARRCLADGGAYARLVLRTAAFAPPVGRDSGELFEGGFWSVLWNAFRRVRKLVTRPRLALRFALEIKDFHRESAARAAQRLVGLGSEGVGELAIFGSGLVARTLATVAPDLDMRVVERSDDPAEIARAVRAAGATARVLIAHRDHVSARRQALLDAGLSESAIEHLDTGDVDHETQLICPEVTRPELEPTLSILLPTRGRTTQVIRLLREMCATAKDPDQLEVVLYLDEDDHASHELAHPTLALHKIIGPRRRMGQITNLCVREARGRNLLLFNDDVQIHSDGWDYAINQALASHPDGIALVYGNDLHQRHRNATFPAFARPLVDALGQVTLPSFNHYHIESHLMDIFLRLRRLGHDRLVYLSDVAFAHYRLTHAPERTIEQRQNGVDDRVTYATRSEDRAYAAHRLAMLIESLRPSASR